MVVDSGWFVVAEKYTALLLFSCRRFGKGKKGIRYVVKAPRSSSQLRSVTTSPSGNLITLFGEFISVKCALSARLGGAADGWIECIDYGLNGRMPQGPDLEMGDVMVVGGVFQY